ncbi:MAG TPA: hypothetical protein VMV86_06290 [Methanosarcinales archaeon]|nr:hypothetical protein [Methanosarcinales archaeon]
MFVVFVKRKGTRLKMELIFKKEKETKNTIRYQEVTKRERAIIGALYILKSELGDLGETIKVSITNEGK